MFRVTLLSVLSLRDQPSLFSPINYGMGRQKKEEKRSAGREKWPFCVIFF